MITIGIIGPTDDQEVRAVRDRLEMRGIEPWIVDLSQFPKEMPIEFKASDVQIEGRSILDMDAAYLRKVDTSLPEYATYSLDSKPIDLDRWKSLHADTVATYQSERQIHALRTSAIEFLARKRTVINPPRQQNLHRLKTLLFDKLSDSGLPCPAYAAGVDKERLLCFARRSFERWSGAVTKPPAGIYKTELWSETAWRSHPFSKRPALYQRYIKGDTVRCFVVEGRLVSAARIVHGGTVDSSKSQTGIQVMDLEPYQAKIAEDAAKCLDLAFCGMDLMLEDDTARAFVIDVNMSPMFVNYIKLSGHDIAGHLANLLISKAKRQSEYKPPTFIKTVEDTKKLLQNDPELAALFKRAAPPRKKAR